MKRKTSHSHLTFCSCPFRLRQTPAVSYSEPSSPRSHQKQDLLNELDLVQNPMLYPEGTTPLPMDPLQLSLPRKPWQMLTPGADFDLATAPEGTTVRDQVRNILHPRPV